MGASTRDIFGAAPQAAPATAGSYGKRPGAYRLPDATRLGRVRLQVSSLDRSLAFYETVLGMRVIERSLIHAVMGAHGEERPLIELHENRDAKPAPRRGRLGLYHFAILMPDRASLGRFVQHLAEIGARAGASDHLVSEAFYLQDPDNLGIEVYADRPRSEWYRVGEELMMASDPIDMNSLVAAAGGTPWTGMPAGTTMGHVHLHVGTIEKAAEFYSEGVGFDKVVWSYPGALFLSAGGYHHHLGTNTWAGPDAGPAGADEARLLEWTMELPTAADVDAVGANLQAHGHAVTRSEESPGSIVARDPWGTAVRVRPV